VNIPKLPTFRPSSVKNTWIVRRFWPDRELSSEQKIVPE
jgi:hypothetical protein